MAQSCTAAELLSASKCLCGIPSDQRETVMIYLLQQLAGLGNLTAAQLLDRAKCLCGLSERDMKAIEVALLCAATGGVPPCPPCPPSGGCTYQDMQVAWTPTSTKLGERLGFFTFGDVGLPANLVFDQTTNSAGWDIESDPNVQTISWPNLVRIDPLNTQGGGILLTTLNGLVSVSFPWLINVSFGNFNITGCPLLASFSAPLLHDVLGLAISGTALTSISFPSLVSSVTLNITNNPLLTSFSAPLWTPTNGQNVGAGGSALNQASVDAIIAAGVANAGYVSGGIDLSGGTNSAPSVAGLANKAILNARQAGLCITN